jgi:hypothetical protein
MSAMSTLPDCLEARRTAQWALGLAQKARDELDILRNAQDAGPVTIPTHRARYMRDEANVIAAWLTKPILHKPTDFDIHAQIEMQRKIAWISDMLTAAIQPMSIVDN